MKFIADDMVGKLAKWLRVLGYDTLYIRDVDDEVIVQRALAEDRIILTRDTYLIGRKAVKKCLLIRGDNWVDQIKQVIKELKLKVVEDKLFTRCIECNTPIVSMPKGQVKALVPPYVYQTQAEFWHCPGCKRVYWEGTHWENMCIKIKGLI